jgi:hypothetical protein
MKNEAFIRPDLPALEELTEAERRWLGIRLRRLRDLSGMTLGSFAEAVVAEALPGALEAPEGTARVDIAWTPRANAKPIAVEVKHSRGNLWNVSERNAREGGVPVRRRRADVYVLANHEGDDHRTGWTFYVVPCWQLDQWGRGTVSESRLAPWGVCRIAAEQLPSAVTAAAATARDARRLAAPALAREGRTRRKWDRAQFEQHLARASLRPEFKDLVSSILALVDRCPHELTASFGTGDRGSVTLKRHGKGLLELHGDGRLWWRPRKFPGALGASAPNYTDALLRLFPATRDMGYPHTTVEETSRQAVALLEVMKSALSAASTAEASSAPSRH